MDKEWHRLVVLDACRYDLFIEVVGQSPYIISVGSHTSEWVLSTFKNEFYDIVYISASPYVSRPFLLEQLGRVPFTHLEQVWLYGWNYELRTVHPRTVSEVALEMNKTFPDKRMIIHYLQPHYPFIGRKRIGQWGGLERLREDLAGVEVKSEPRKMPCELVRDGEVSKEEYWEAYKANLELVWEEIKRIADKLKGRVVVTSDHGDCIGEYEIYDHPPEVYVEELVKVPWYVIKEE